MKKEYFPPAIESESAFEVLAAMCGQADPGASANCDPEMCGSVFS
jgi:hypothetical protein